MSFCVRNREIHKGSSALYVHTYSSTSYIHTIQKKSWVVTPLTMYAAPPPPYSNPPYRHRSLSVESPRRATPTGAAAWSATQDEASLSKSRTESASRHSPFANAERCVASSALPLAHAGAHLIAHAARSSPAQRIQKWLDLL